MTQIYLLMILIEKILIKEILMKKKIYIIFFQKNIRKFCFSGFASSLLNKKNWFQEKYKSFCSLWLESSIFSKYKKKISECVFLFYGLISNHPEMWKHLFLRKYKKFYQENILRLGPEVAAEYTSFFVNMRVVSKLVRTISTVYCSINQHQKIVTK